MHELGWVTSIMGFLTLILALFIYLHIKKQPNGTGLIQEIEGVIHDGTMVFLKKECTVLLVFAVCCFLLLGFFLREWYTPAAFAAGAMGGIVAIFAGLKAATRGNSRTSEAARMKGESGALGISYLAGSVMGLSVAGIGLLGTGVCFWWLGGAADTAGYIGGFAIGASVVALFVRIGGGIYAKAADEGADLAVMIEAGIPDNSSNPGVITNNVGGNVGNIAGLGAELFESYAGAIIASIIIGASMTITPEFFQKYPLLEDRDIETVRALYMALPLMIAVAGQIGSIIGIFSLKAFKGRTTAVSLRCSIFTADIIFCLLAALAVWWMGMPWGILCAVLSGVGCGIALGFISEYYTSGPPASFVSEQARSGPGRVIIAGIASGMRSTWGPVLLVFVVIIAGYHRAGIYGLGMAALGMIATAGIMMSMNAFSSIVDNAGEISAMSGSGPAARRILDALGSTGNATSCIGRGGAAGSALLTAVAVWGAFVQTAGLKVIDLTNLAVLGAFLIGAMIPMWMTAMTITSVGRAAYKIMDEIRRQFREIPGLLEGREGVKSDPNACVSIATGASIMEMVAPVLIALLMPVAVGFLLGAEALGGLILGVVVMGFPLSLFMVNSGCVWNNVRKYIESGNLGGRGSENNRAAAAGDMVGDPLRDTAAPTVNTIMKVTAIVSLIIAPLLGKGWLSALF